MLADNVKWCLQHSISKYIIVLFSTHTKSGTTFYKSGSMNAARAAA